MPRRTPAYMRDMLSSRNKSDCWNRKMAEDLEYHLHYAIRLMQSEELLKKPKRSEKIAQMIEDLYHELSNALRR